jgi:hypothetical protein
MKNLKEIYEEGRDIKDSEIPDIWKESFSRFMLGQTCCAEYEEDGRTIKEFIYYGCDFRIWYHQNKEAIERDIKIDETLKK